MGEAPPTPPGLDVEVVWSSTPRGCLEEAATNPPVSVREVALTPPCCVEEAAGYPAILRLNCAWATLINVSHCTLLLFASGPRVTLSATTWACRGHHQTQTPRCEIPSTGVDPRPESGIYYPLKP